MGKRVLFIAHDSKPYGGNQSLINIVSSLKDKGVFVSVVFPNKEGICDVFIKNGWDYNIVDYRTELCQKPKGLVAFFKNTLRFFYNKYKNAIAIKKISVLVDDNRINIIHSNSSVVAIGVDLAKRKNKVHVWHLREYIHPNYGLFVIGGLKKYKKKIQSTKNIICITDGVAKAFEVEDKAIVLNDAVRRSPKYNEPISKDKYFLFCGSLIKNKGIEEAIMSFHKVFIKDKNYKLLIVGTGSLGYEEYLKEKVCKIGMEENVEFLGFRDDIDDLMAKASAFLMCSRNEALGRVTIEAMLNFCLVIGYNDCGTAEIVKHGETGFLYSKPDELVEYMSRIVDDIERLNFMRDNAYQYAINNFLEDSFSDNLLKYYDGLGKFS